MRSYTVDPTAARQANENSYIDQSGKYVGTFALAEAVKSEKGTEGIEFTFRTNNGQQANFLTLWTFNGQGEALYGFKLLSAILTVMGVKEISPKNGNIKKPDGQTQQTIAYPDLHSKPIGLVLQKEFYIKRNGDEGYKFNILAPFQASTELMAKELLDGKTEPRALSGIVSSLKDKLAPTSQRAQGNTGAQAYPATNNHQVDDPFGDDFGTF